MKKLASMTIFASAVVWASVILALFFIAPESVAMIIPFIGGGIAIQLGFIANLANRVIELEKQSAK
ncbi:MAG: hypothetical protein FH749_11630 [Firmicutes bacterium]|nr:hypothetical protein [Bacillota bacterium]